MRKRQRDKKADRKKMESRAEISKGGDAVKKNGESDLKNVLHPANTLGE